LLKVIGLKVFWPDRIKPRLPGVRRAATVWDRISRFVVRRPVWVWCVSAGLLAPFAALGLMTTPTFSPVGDLSPTSGSILGLAAPTALARGHYVASYPEHGVPQFVTRLDVVLKSDPFAPESAATLETIETWLADFLPTQAGRMGPVRAECYGVPVHTRDMGAVIERDRARVNLLVLGGIILVLLVLVPMVW